MPAGEPASDMHGIGVGPGRYRHRPFARALPPPARRGRSAPWPRRLPQRRGHLRSRARRVDGPRGCA